MNSKNCIIAIGIVVIGIALVHGFQLMRGDVVVTEQNFKNLPHQIGAWTGVDKTFTDAIYKELRADENFYRIYTRPDGAELGLYIGYYGTKRGGHPDHVPTGCYPGSGWGIEAITPFTITSLDGTKTITVNNLYASKGDEAEQTLYWLQNFLGTVTHEGIRQNFEKMHTLLTYNRNDGAFIRVNARVTESREKTLAMEKEFIQELMPLLPQYWPKEEVKK